MSTNGKVKLYKNPARNKPENYKPYVPQYQELGRDPEEYQSPLGPNYRGKVAQAAPSQDNPRTPRPAIRQPYAEAVRSPVGRGRGPLPNVGNNVEQTWSSVDGDIIDDISSVESQNTMVDNNEFVSAAALGLSEEPAVRQESVPFNSFVTEEDIPSQLENDGIATVLQHLDENEYLLMIKRDILCSGSMEYVQEQARLLIFGEHPNYQGDPVSVDDIVILKRISIKVGVFLE